MLPARRREEAARRTRGKRQYKGLDPQKEEYRGNIWDLPTVLCCVVVVKLCSVVAVILAF